MDSILRNASLAARVLSMLYVALLICTPWVIRESTLLLPPSAFASAQATSVAASVAIERLGRAFPARFCESLVSVIRRTAVGGKRA